MPTGLVDYYTKSAQTWSVKGIKQHYLGSNHKVATLNIRLE